MNVHFLRKLLESQNTEFVQLKKELVTIGGALWCDGSAIYKMVGGISTTVRAPCCDESAIYKMVGEVSNTGLNLPKNIRHPRLTEFHTKYSTVSKLC